MFQVIIHNHKNNVQTVYAQTELKSISESIYDGLVSRFDSIYSSFGEPGFISVIIVETFTIRHARVR